MNISLLCVFSVLLRDLFILQAVGLVFTYNFSNCNFKKISDIYSETIFPDLSEYLNGVSEETFFFEVYIHILMKEKKVNILTSHNSTFKERKII